MTTLCRHYKWVNDRSQGKLLVCVDCDTPWPGHDLPIPAHIEYAKTAEPEDEEIGLAA